MRWSTLGLLAAVAVPTCVAVAVPLVLTAVASNEVQTPAASTVTAAHVPDPYGPLVNSAGQRCATITAPVIAAQIEAESGWNPAAVSPVGAQGLTQFMPATWAIWGRDADHNGRTSPFDPADAIDAQGRFMCSLADTMTAATRQGSVHGDVLQLALAAYNAGPGAVIKYAGIPPYAETRGYVRHITALIPKYTDTQGGSHAGGGPVPASFDQQDNPRTVEQAIAYITSFIPGGPPGEPVRGRCERLAGNIAYGLPSGYPTAVSHWMAPGPRSISTPAPRGALVFIASPNEAEHVVLSLGGGMAYSTDFDARTQRWAPGVTGIGRIDIIAQAMGGPVRGWRAPNFRPGSEAD